MRKFLAELNHQVHQTLNGTEAGELDVRVAHTQIVEGHYFVGRVLLRLPLPPGNPPRWVSDDAWSAAERALGRGLAVPPSEGSTIEGTLVRLTLVRTGWGADTPG